MTNSYKNIFLKHNKNSDDAFFDTDYDAIVIEVRTYKKMIHKQSDYIFPYTCIIQNNKEIFYKDLNKEEYQLILEEFDETISIVKDIQKLMQCPIILAPPITTCLNLPLKIQTYRNEIIERCKAASKFDNIKFYDWNEPVLEKGVKRMIQDQYHFTLYG